MTSRPHSTFLFADLVGFTTLTERCGNEAAARVAHRFLRAIDDLSRAHGAVCVKSLGDGAMIWAPGASRAVALAGRILDEVGTRPDLLPVRVGADTGPVTVRGGDAYGHAINVAARLAREAEPNEALIGDATRAAAPASAQHRLTRRRELELRGLSWPVVVWRMAAARAPRSAATFPAGAHRRTSAARAGRIAAALASDIR